jgi:hypothetical protein
MGSRESMFLLGNRERYSRVLKRYYLDILNGRDEGLSEKEAESFIETLSSLTRHDQSPAFWLRRA